MYLIFFIDIK